MLWFLVVHIGALLFWCGGLLYLPALIVSESTGRENMVSIPRRHDSMARFVFTQIATPAALLAIIAGTVVFLLNQTTEFWLVAKLTLVAGLAIVHALAGLLVMRAEDEGDKAVVLWCWVLAIALSVLMIAIVWIVLAKPTLELPAWAG